MASIEARTASSRLPGKVMLDLAGKPVLQHIIERLRRSRYLDDIVVATTTNPLDGPIVDLCTTLGCRCYRGSEADVLSRVFEAATTAGADILVEITADCPCVDWRHVDHLVEVFLGGSYDYASNVVERSFPDGFDVQVFSTSLLGQVSRLTTSLVDREHVSYYIYTHPETYLLFNWRAEGLMNHPELAVTLDTPEDYVLIEEIFSRLYSTDADFTAEDVVGLLVGNEGLQVVNSHVRRKDPRQEQESWRQHAG